MKHFEFPELEILRFEVEDIMTSSGDEFPYLPLNKPSANECQMIPMD